MSNATIESPVAASQLFFAWSEQAEVGSAPSAATKKSTRAAKNSAAGQRPQPSTAQLAHTDSRQQDSQQSVKRPVNQPAVTQPAIDGQPQTAGGNGQSAFAPVTAASVTRQSAAAASTGHLTFTSDGRIARPVRIGSVMIKLLKRYGITDAEIAEGVASYARKHQQAWAS